jgi:hypothetical protein
MEPGRRKGKGCIRFLCGKEDVRNVWEMTGCLGCYLWIECLGYLAFFIAWLVKAISQGVMSWWQ